MSIGAEAANQPGAVIQLANAATLAAGNYITTPQVSLSGYYAANDGGEGTFALITTPAPLTMTGQAHSGSNVIDTLSANPSTQHWVPGLVLTDSAGRIPANTVIVSLTSTTITLSQNMTGSTTGDTLTVAANGGTILTDGGGNYFQRTNATNDTRQWGLTQGSAYDAQVNGASATSSTGVMTKAMGAMLGLGLTNVNTGQVGLYLATTLNVPVSTTLNCGATGGAPKTGAVFLNVPGTLFLGHGAEIAFPAAQDVSYISHCVVLPIWYKTPSYATSNCSLNGNLGITFNQPIQNKDDLEAIRSNMIVCGDTGIHFIDASGGKSNNVWVFGFDAGWFSDRADHSNSTDIYLDDNVCFYLKKGGGQTDFGNTDCAQYLTRQVKTSGGTGSLIVNEQNWSITNITAASTTNAFGQHECQLTLGPAAVVSNVSELHSSTMDAQGDPIGYPSWVYNLSNGGGHPSGAVSCRGYGAFPAQVISTDPGTNTAVVTLKGSAFAHGTDAVTLTGTWASGSQWVYITSGNVNALSIGETITATGISATVDSVCRDCKGQHPYDPYIAMIHIDTAATLSGTDATLTFDSGAFAPDSHTCQDGRVSVGYCFTYNQAERTTSGNSAAATDLAMLPIAQGHHYGTCFAVYGTAGSFNNKTYCYGHRIGYVVQDANNSSFVQEGGDDNGELNDFGQYFISFLGSSNQSAFFGQQGGKAGVGIVNNLYSADEDNTVVNTTISNVNGVTTGLGTMTLASSPPVTNGGRYNVDICQTLSSDGTCSSLGFGNYETVTVKVTGSSMALIARGEYFSPALTFTNGAHVIYTAITAPTGCASLNSTSDPTTQGGLNGLEAVSGCLMMTNVRINGVRQLVITHNATSTILNGNSIPDAAFLYEDQTAQDSAHGCGNVVTGGDCWFKPNGATSSTTIQDLGDRVLSLLDFGGVPDWSTDNTAALTAAMTAALTNHIHVIRLDPKAGVGSGYKFSSLITVPTGINLYCPGSPYSQPTNNDFRNYPNAIIPANTGFKFSGGNGYYGNCHFIQQTLATSSPPTTIQDQYTRQAAFIGTAVTCQGANPCNFEGGSIMGFAQGIKPVGAKAYNARNIRADNTLCWEIKQAGEGLTQFMEDLICRPYATSGVSASGTVPALVRIATSSITDNAGVMHATYASTCSTTSCPLEGYIVAIVNPVGAQSAQGSWCAKNVTSSGFDLYYSDCTTPSDSAYLSGKTLSANIAAGSNAITINATLSTEVKTTQAVTGSCITGTAHITFVEVATAQIFIDQAVTCTATENIVIADSAGSAFEVTNIVPVAAGTGYIVGDHMTLVGGTFTSPAEFDVATIDGSGGITSVTVTDGGSYTVLPGAATTATGGTGTGATFTATAGIQTILTPNTRSGPCFQFESTNAVYINNVQCQAHAVGAWLGFGGTSTTRVMATNCKFDDENLIQDDTRIGVLFDGASRRNSFTQCPVFYSSHRVVDQTDSGSTGAANSYTDSNLSTPSGAGYNSATLEVLSSPPGTPKNKGFVFSGNYSGQPGGAYFSSDVNKTVIFSGNSFNSASFTVYCQTEAVAQYLVGVPNAAASNSCPSFSRAPGTITASLVPGTTADVYLHNSDCGTSFSSGSAGGTVRVYLPSSPVPGCRMTLRPFNNMILLNGAGNPIRTIDVTAVLTDVQLPAAGGAPQIAYTWDTTSWRTDGGAPETYAQSSTGNGQRRANGQFYMSYDNGNSRLQVCAAGGPGGITLNKVLYVLSACSYLDVSAFSGVTSSLRYIYAVRNSTTITSIVDDGSGHAKLTLNTVTGMNTGTPITCVNVDGTPLANVYNDANTVVSGSTVALTDVSYVAGNTTGSCFYTGLTQTTASYDVVDGVAVRHLTNAQTLVGVVYVDGSSHLNDSAALRDVASFYNRQPKSCVKGFTADRTTASDTFVEVNSETECEFVTWGAISAMGLPAPEELWSTSGMIGNDTASDGAMISVGFDGATPQTQVGAFKNAAAGGGGAGNAASWGSVAGLAEGKHYATIVGRRITGGTATFYGTTPITTVTVQVMQ